ncbi:MAG: hypothetical protein HOQ12_02320, partial [Gemmatimonadaceae bacterium]|nr:hypothetical protein [Gemmatimonadaceae bacterium]
LLPRVPDALAEPPESRVARRRETSGAAAKVATPPSVAIVAAEPAANARLVEIERAAKAYEAAISALVAEAEAKLVEPDEETGPADVAAAPSPVAMPESAVAPVESTAPPKRPHSIAVIVARGADF